MIFVFKMSVMKNVFKFLLQSCVMPTVQNTDIMGVTILKLRAKPRHKRPREVNMRAHTPFYREEELKEIIRISDTERIL